MTPHLNAVKRRYEDHQRNQRAVNGSRKDLRKAVERARKSHTLAEIGEVLGITRQGVYDLLKR